MTETVDLESEAISSFTDLDRLKALYSSGIRPEHFFDPVNASAAGWVFDYFKESAFSNAPTGAALLSEFPSLELVEPQESVAWTAKELKKRFVANRMRSLMIGVSEEVSNDPIASAKKLLDGTWKIVSSVEERLHVSSLKDATEARMARFKERRRASSEGSLLGIPIGFEEVDKYTGGVQETVYRDWETDRKSVV